MMAPDEEQSETLNVRVPKSLADSIDEVYSQRGFSSKSEFVRSALRDALSPERMLSESISEDISVSEEQIDQGQTKSLDNVFSGSEDDDQQEGGLGGLISRSLVQAEESGFETRDDAPKIVIIGVGGGGNNTIHRLNDIGIKGAETVAINTDKQHLNMVNADTKILVGKSITEGLGAGGDPEMGERATEMAQGTIKDVLDDADLVFVTAGMGGGTGTGGAPVISKVAKEQGAIVVGMVSMPFNVERARTVKAEEGLEKLRDEADSVIVFDHNQLLDYVPDLPIGKAFSVMDQIIAETVKGICETITQPSLINLDYADIVSVMGSGGIGMMLTSEIQGNSNIDEVTKNTMSHPLLDIDYHEAGGGIVNITGGPGLTLEEAESIVENIISQLEGSANVIWGARIQEGYEDKIRVDVILTGIHSSESKVFQAGLTSSEQFAGGTEDIPGKEDAELLPNSSGQNQSSGLTDHR